MDYQTFQPHPDLKSLVKCYWTLEVPPSDSPQRQRIIPDGCLEMAFILGDDIRRYTTGEEFILQPRAMVLGQTIDPFYIEPTGYVNTFAIRFYPYGFANFVTIPVRDLANKETPLEVLFGEKPAKQLEQKIILAESTSARIAIAEEFLMEKFISEASIDGIVKSTVDMLLSTGGSTSIHAILKEDLPKRRKLERQFLKRIGISPKQLGRVVRLQTALKLLLNRKTESLTEIAYESEYYDQAHFIKDFREFTGTTPGAFPEDDKMALSSLFYRHD